MTQETLYTEPSTSSRCRRSSPVNYRLSESSNEEPFSPPVSEYVPNSDCTPSTSPVRDLDNPIPSSLLKDLTFSLNEDIFLSSPFTTGNLNDLVFIASPTVIFVPSPYMPITTANTTTTGSETTETPYTNILAESFIEGITPLPNETLPEQLSISNQGESITHPGLECASSSVFLATEPEATVSQPLLVTEGNYNPRKRQKNTDKWAKVEQKKLRNTGMQPQKHMMNPCACKLKCFETIGNEDRLNLFTCFWATGSHETQWHFILKNTEITEPKVIKVQRKRERNRTVIYYLPLKNNTGLIKRIKVCKTMFLNTLGIKERTVYTVIDKYNKGNAITDLRGKHANRPHKTRSDTEQSVIEHIKSFPCIESHYLRQKTNRQYLSQDLNISKMHRLYKVWFSENEYFPNVKVASEYQYNQIFNSQFNLSFFRPKKDICKLCSEYENATEEAKLQLQQQYEIHIKNKEIVRNIKNMEKESVDPKIKTVAVFDLEKVLSLPQSNVGIFHYKRKYPAYNFTVYNLISRQGYCFLWHAQIAKRGANEIASCLYSFFNAEANRGIKSLSLYSDNCSGQNRNRFIFSMYLFVSRTLHLEIIHRFLQTGHTQNEGDSMHACIEKNMKNKTVYTPDQLYEIIMNAKIQNKFIINEMSQADFYNFKSQVTSNKNWLHDTNGNKVLFSKIKEVKACPEIPNKLFFKYDFENNDYLVLDTTNRTSSRTRKTNVCSENSNELLRAYNNYLPISSALYKDLINLCNTNAIPLHYQGFYRNLVTQNDTVNLEVFDSSDED